MFKAKRAGDQPIRPQKQSTAHFLVPVYVVSKISHTGWRGGRRFGDTMGNATTIENMSLFFRR
jgi:hypothetical protein